MKQVLIKRGTISVEDVPAPLIEENNVLVEVFYSLISAGTEISGIKSSGESLIKKALKSPEKVKKILEHLKAKGIRKTVSKIEQKITSATPTGYSCSGVVIQTGKNVKNIKPGDHVACAGGGKAYHAEIVLVPENLTAKVPEGCSLKDAASVTLGSIAMQGVRRADVRLGENVAIIGLGLLGQLTTQLLKSSGTRVIGFDLQNDRIELAEELGLNKGMNTSRVDMVKEVMNFTNGYGVDATIITASSKNDKIVQQAMEITRKKGRIIVVGDVGLCLKRYPFYEKEIDFLISCSYGPGRYDERYEEKNVDYPYAYVRWTEKRNMEEYLKLIAEKKIDFERIVDKTYTFVDASQAYTDLKSTENRPLAIILDYNLETTREEKRKTKIHLIPKATRKGRLKVAVVGAGSFAKNFHLPNLKKLSNLYSIHAIIDQIGSNAKNVANYFGATYCTTDYKEVLNDEEIAAIFITTRHNLHAQMAIETAKSGKAVFLEKPMALNQKELDELVNTLRQTGVPFMVGFNRRFSPITQKVKKIIQNRESPLIINYRVNAGYLPKEHWVYTEEGGGRIIGEACHMIDLIRYLTESKVESFDVSSISTKTEHILPDDNFTLTLKCTDGSLCILTYTSLGAKEFGKEYIGIYLDGKTLVINDFKILEIYGRRQKGSKGKQDKGHMQELVEFAKFVSRVSDAPITLEQLIETTELSFLINETLKQTN